MSEQASGNDAWETAKKDIERHDREFDEKQGKGKK